MTTERWAIDTAHSSVDFVVRHMVVSKTRGTFTDWKGAIDVDRDDPEKSSVTATIVVASIDTRDKKRDAHLLSADFFDAQLYPTITFMSRRVEIHGRNLKVIGDLTLHGVTQDIALDVEYNGMNHDPWGNARIHYSARMTLHRKDFGVGWNQAIEAGGVLIGESVAIEIEVEALTAVVPAKQQQEAKQPVEKADASLHAQV
jgi:polyisoprenoid-binding protein YceI